MRDVQKFTIHFDLYNGFEKDTPSESIKGESKYYQTVRDVLHEVSSGLTSLRPQTIIRRVILEVHEVLYTTMNDIFSKLEQFQTKDFQCLSTYKHSESDYFAEEISYIQAIYLSSHKSYRQLIFLKLYLKQEDRVQQQIIERQMN